MTILIYRDGGMTRAEVRHDDEEAKVRARVIAEMHGECDAHKIESWERFTHSRAVPHAQIPLDPEVILGDSRP